MEDPTAIREIGIELRLEAQVGSLALRGIIDRLELDADGGLVVTDYKTGRAPGLKYEQGRLAGVHFYSFLCEEVLGRRPSAIRLMYLRTGETITAAAIGAVGQVHHHPHDRGVEGSRASLQHRQLPAAAGPAVRVVLVSAMVPGIRWRSRTGRRRGATATRRARRVNAVELVRPLGRCVSSNGFAATRSPTRFSRQPVSSATSA